MPPDQNTQFGLRLAVGAIGVILLALGGLAASALLTHGWRWWLALLALVCFVEAIDFLLAATRRRGGWPSGANLLLDALLPG
jgi:hypothetical protein